MLLIPVRFCRDAWWSLFRTTGLLQKENATAITAIQASLKAFSKESILLNAFSFKVVPSSPVVQQSIVTRSYRRQKIMHSPHALATCTKILICILYSANYNFPSLYIVRFALVRKCTKYVPYNVLA